MESEDYKKIVFNLEDKYNCMFITTFTKKYPPLPNLGPLTEEYSLSADYDDRWRTGGTEEDIIKEARLDPNSILKSVLRFILDYDKRMQRQVFKSKSLLN